MKIADHLYEPRTLDQRNCADQLPQSQRLCYALPNLPCGENSGAALRLWVPPNHNPGRTDSSPAPSRQAVVQGYVHTIPHPPPMSGETFRSQLMKDVLAGHPRRKSTTVASGIEAGRSPAPELEPVILRWPRSGPRRMRPRRPKPSSLSSSPPGLTRWSMLKCSSAWIAGSSPAMTNGEAPPLPPFASYTRFAAITNLPGGRRGRRAGCGALSRSAAKSADRSQAGIRTSHPPT